MVTYEAIGSKNRGFTSVIISHLGIIEKFIWKCGELLYNTNAVEPVESSEYKRFRKGELWTMSIKQFVNLYEAGNIDYRNIIERIFKAASYFEIVDQYDELCDFIKPIESCFIKVRRSNKWEGTKTSKKTEIMSFQCNERSRDFFLKFDDFITDDNGTNCAYGTEFQFDTIFYKENGDKAEPVFYSITHEGIANIEKSLLEL